VHILLAAFVLAFDTICSAPIPATMVDTVKSATAYPGMPFHFKITVTARIDDVLVPENTIGRGFVRQVTPAGYHDQNGTLVLEMRELYFGNKVLQVIADPLDTAIWAPLATLTDAAEDLAPIPGLIRTAVNSVRKGRDVTIGPGFAFHIIGLPDPKAGSPCHKVGT